MDLSFPRFDRSADLVTWRGDWAVLMVGVAARQLESETAEVQARLDAGPFAPVDGTFNRGVAEAITLWRRSEDAVYRGVSADLQVPQVSA